MATLDRDGVEIYYEVHGRGPALLLSHGFSATSKMWRGQIDELSRDHTLVLWDMRGHGRSAYPEDPRLYSETLTVGDMAALLDEVDAGSTVVGGLSLGGYMSLAFHAAQRERVAGLLVIDTGPGYKNDAGRAAWNRTAEAMAADLEAKGLASLDGRSPEMAAQHHRSAEGLVLAGRHMLTQRDATVIQSLPSIAVPTLVLVGEHDAPFRRATDYMAAKIPGAAKVVVPGAGHAANIDQPEAFNRALRAFLDEYGL